MKNLISRSMSTFVVFALIFGSHFNAQASSTTATTSLVANQYYVSITGNDANICSQSAPCKTIKKGISVTQNGDTVIVSAGVYREYVAVNKSITVISNGATIDGVNASGTVTDGLVSVTANNVRFQGFTISNAKTYGLANFGSNNQFISNVIHHTQGAGIWMRDGKFNTFDGNELYDTVLLNSVSFDGAHYTCSPTATSWPSAINSWGAASFNLWRNNNVHDNCGEGMVVYTGDLVENNTFKNNWSNEIYIIANQTIVRNNTVIDTKPYTPHGSDQSWRNVPAGIAIGDETVCLTDSNTITGNTVTGARYGISFYQYIACSGVKNTLIENNTIINTWEYGLRIPSGAHTNSTIRNNTIRLTSGKPLTIQNGGFTVTGNTFFSNTNVFDWNGKSYDFAGWNAIVPGNFWGTAGTVTITPTTQVIPTSTSVPTLKPTSTIPAATATAAPTNTPTSNPPTATSTIVVVPASPTNTATSNPPTATSTAVVVPASPTNTPTSNPPTATPTSLFVPAAPTNTPTSNPPTATSTTVVVPASPTNTQIVIPPTATATTVVVPASPTNTQIVIPPTATSTTIVVPASPTNTQVSNPPTATPTALVIPASPTPTFVITSLPPTAIPTLINPSESGKVFDDKSYGFVYSSGWRNEANRRAYKNSYMFTTRNGSSMTFAFKGQSFSVIYKGGTAFGKLDVYIDNILVGTIDEKTPASSFQQRWDYPGLLTSGAHTLKLVFVTTDPSKKIFGSIDAVIIR